MAEVGRKLRRANVFAIFLIHGTFAGNDAFGLFRELARIHPAAGTFLRRHGKQLTDLWMQDGGNYTSAYASRLEAALESEDNAPIAVHRFLWSSENHHIGRADGAVRLIDEIGRITRGQPGRVLCIGHSHGGNLLALVSNLLTATPAIREKFFHACRSFYRPVNSGNKGIPAWLRCRERLIRGNPLPGITLDMVTCGTPVRYGWDSAGYGRLLHFINHHPGPKTPPWLAAFPESLEEITTAAGGDYVQQFGIAGTNFPPGWLEWRARLADIRLNAILQADIRKRDLPGRLKLGQRVPAEGKTLLIDYGQPESAVHEHLAGHAVYTRTEWMEFQMNCIARELYTDQ